MNLTPALKKLSIIIPAYNEGPTVSELLSRVWLQPLPEGLTKEIVIVESNSTDGTRIVVQDFADKINQKSPGAVKLILQTAGRGKGNAVREGLNAVTGDIILIQDADLEYDTADYPALLEPLLTGHASFVLGSRHLSAGHWKIRRFEASPIPAFIMNLGGIFFHRLFNLIYGVELTDPTTMYKVFRRDCISGVTFVSNHFDFDFELVAKLIRTGHIPYEIPVSYNSRGFEQGKKVRVLRDPLTWIWAILRFRFVKMAQPAKARISSDLPMAND